MSYDRDEEFGSDQRQRRRDARVPCRMIVERVGPAIDLSASGLRVLSANPLPAGSVVSLTFEVPEIGASVKCTGSVVHVTPSRFDRDLLEMGVAFDDLSGESRKQIEGYVALRSEPVEVQ